MGSLNSYPAWQTDPARGNSGAVRMQGASGVLAQVDWSRTKLNNANFLPVERTHLNQ